MALPELEVNDIISTKDGRTLRVQRIHKSGNEIIRIDGTDDNAASPMLTPIFANNIARILKKNAANVKAEKEANQKAYDKWLAEEKAKEAKLKQDAEEEISKKWGK